MAPIFRIIAARVLLTCNAVFMSLVFIGFGILMLNVLTASNIETRANIAWLALGVWDWLTDSDFWFVVPLLGVAYLYTGTRAKPFRSGRIFADSDPLGSGPLSTAVNAASLLAAITAAISSSSWLAGLGFYLGVLVASGGGMAFKSILWGAVAARIQLLAFLSALALALGSWLASWASFGVGSLIIQGGYLAPALGFLSGLFMQDSAMFKRTSAPSTPLQEP